MLRCLATILHASRQWLAKWFEPLPLGICCMCGETCEPDDWICDDCILDRAV